MAAASALRHPLWAALRGRAEPASVPELADAIGATSASIAWRLSRWAAAGLLHSIKPDNDQAAPGQPASRRTRYLMADNSRSLTAPPALDAAARPTRTRSGRDAMWRAIRVLRRFDLVQLTLAAEVTEHSAKQYVSCLLRAGILRRDLRGHAASGQRSVYSLAGRFGPLTPIVRQRIKDGVRGQEVWDPNSGTGHQISAQRPCAPLF